MNSLLSTQVRKTFKYLNSLKEAIINITKKTYQIDNNEISLEFSVGYALYPDDTTDINELISYADLAMLECLAHKKNIYERYEPHMSYNLNLKVEMANEIKESIELDLFEIHFQPIVDAKTNSVKCLESLARWNNKRRGQIPPDTFLPIAKKSGLMFNLDLYLIKKSLREFAIISHEEKYRVLVYH